MYRLCSKTAATSQFSASRLSQSPRSRIRISFPEGASCLASVPPPAPLPMMMTSKRLSMHAPLEADAVLHDAAIREDGGCGDVARAVAGEEADHARTLLGARHAPERYGRIQLGELGRIVHRAEIDRRRHRARTHADHENAVAGELDPRRAREHPHAAFGEAIGG